MNITDERIDAGKAFDWGRTSEDYAKFRDIYPPIFYRKLVDRGLCIDAQKPRITQQKADEMDR